MNIIICIIWIKIMYWIEPVHLRCSPTVAVFGISYTFILSCLTQLIVTSLTKGTIELITWDMIFIWVNEFKRKAGYQYIVPKLNYEGQLFRDASSNRILDQKISVWRLYSRSDVGPMDFICGLVVSLHWRQNERDGVSNHRRLDCLPNCLFRRRSKEILKFCVTGFCEGNPPVSGEFQT